MPNVLFWVFSKNPQRYLFRAHAKTQPMMNRLYQPVDVLLVGPHAADKPLLPH